MDGIVLIDSLAHTNDLDFINKYLQSEEELGGNFLSPKISDMMAQISGRKEIEAELNSVKDIIMMYIREAVCKRTQKIYELYKITFIDGDSKYTVAVSPIPNTENHFIILKTDSHPKLQIGDIMHTNEDIIVCKDKSKISVEIIEITDYI